jgi:hypothetical protein
LWRATDFSPGIELREASVSSCFVVSANSGAVQTMDTIPSNNVSPAQSVGAYPISPRSHLILHYLFQLLIPAAIFLFIGVSLVTAYLEKFLWMAQLHYTGIFWTLFSVQWAMFAVAFVVVFVFIWVNLRQALVHSGAAVRGKMRRPVLTRSPIAAAFEADRIDFALSEVAGFV